MTFTSMNRVMTVATVVAMTVVMAGCPVDPPDCTATTSVAHRDLRYASSPGVSANLQSLDLYTPTLASGCGATPLVIYVHGGAFINGDKANKVAQKIDLFTGEGWAFASLNYRLVGDPGAGPTNGVYPAAEQDIASAIAYLHGHADQYAIDAGSLMLLGHSAGAFLVALESTDGSFLDGAGLELADIACTAPLDTTYDIPTQIEGGGTSEAMFRNAFGDDPDVWAQASPARNIAPDKGIPSFRIVTRGTLARISQSQAFGDALRSAGVSAEVQVASGLTHEEVNEAVGQPGETLVTPPLMDFYRRCVAPAGQAPAAS